MMRLLLLEQNTSHAQQLADALSRDGVARCERVDMREFAQRGASDSGGSLDAILLDWPRDEDDRFGLCRQVSGSAVNAPVVSLTSYNDLPEAVRVVEAGAEDVCLVDTFDPDFVLQRIRLSAERYRIQVLRTEPVSVGTLKPRSAPGEINLPSPGETGEHQDASSAKRVFRLLHVNGDTSGEFSWGDAGPRLPDLALDVDHVRHWEEALERLQDSGFDAVLYCMDQRASAELDAVDTLSASHSETPLIVMAHQAAPGFGIEMIQRGADDFLEPEWASKQRLAHCLRLSIARRRRRCVEQVRPSNERASGKQGSAFPRAPSERRQSPRYYVTKSAIAIPVLPDFTPDRSLRAEGFTSDISESGIGFEVSGMDRLPSRLLLTGIEGDDGVLYFATVEVRNWSNLEGRLRIGGQFCSPERDLLRDENLIPTFRAASQRFATGLPTETLYAWAELGIFRPILVDRIYVCPKCGSLPSFRSGCRSCGSIHIASHQLIHHFACAYVGMTSEFEQGGELTCPKCRTRGLVVGADFEHLNGPYHCLDCNWSDTEMEVVGQCLHCHWRFPLQQAGEEELIGYHVNRLDPLALLGSQ